MDGEWVVVISVMAVGYSLYGGLFIAAGAVYDQSSPASTVEEVDGFDSERPDPETGTLQFESADAGLNYTYAATSSSRSMRETQSNAGVYVADYNDDGWSDVLAVGGEQPVLFENVGGEFERTGYLPERDPDVDGNVRAVHWTDFDANGRPDIVLLIQGSPPLLLENVGDGFERRPDAFEEPLTFPVGATSADFTGNGCPDIFVYQNGNWDDRVPKAQRNYSVSVNDDNGNPDYLYRNTCDGFERMNDTGIRGERWTLAASSVDLTGDGRPDIHTANDFNHDVVYLNRGNGTFEQTELPERTNRNGMSSEVADVTGNGLPDIYTTNIYYPDWAADRMNPGLTTHHEGNNLISSLGDGTFVMREDQYGIQKGGFGWAAEIEDFDNDGWKDIFHTTRIMTFAARDRNFSYEERVRLGTDPLYSYPAVWERADQNSFQRVGPNRSGFDEMDGRGVASLDYDRDGDLDLIVANAGGNYRLYENLERENNVIQVRVLGGDGTQVGAYGATVEVDDGIREHRRFVHGHEDFLSQSTRVAHVGVGNRTTADIRVRWPDGTTDTVRDAPVNYRLVITPDGVVSTERLDTPG